MFHQKKIFTLRSTITHTSLNHGSYNILSKMDMNVQRVHPIHEKRSFEPWSLHLHENET